MKIRKALALTAIVGASLTGCAVAETEPNEVGLHYNRGPMEGREFAGIVQPNKRHRTDFLGEPDQVYKYPTDQRSWVSGTDRGPVEFVSKDSVRMHADFELRFVLNLNPETLVAFHEDIGAKRQAYTAEGWVNMLKEFMDPSFEKAVDTAGLRYDWRELRENEDVRRAFEADARELFVQNLRDSLPGEHEFFCGIEHSGEGTTCGEPYFRIAQPRPVNDAIVASIEQEQAAVAQTRTLSAEELRATAEAQARQSQVDQLGPELYVCLRAVEASERVGQAPPPCYAGLGGGVQPTVEVG